ncbi:MAG: hypothetical protein NW205_01195 [Hyphomicrobiaceae bacterium]|nr:hypothetical protein [Hyphomicrobiaceae bacterium]
MVEKFADKCQATRPNLSVLMTTAHAAGFAMVHTEPDEFGFAVADMNAPLETLAPDRAPAPAPARFYLSHARPSREAAHVAINPAATSRALVEWLRGSAYALFGARAATS